MSLTNPLMRRLTSALVLIATVATSLAAQTHPNFAGKWVLDPGRSSIRLTNRSVCGLVRANGVFREVSGTGTVAPDGAVSGTVTVAAASVRGVGEICLDAEVNINRADFGLTWNLMGLISMHNTLTVHAVFTRRWEEEGTDERLSGHR